MVGPISIGSDHLRAITVRLDKAIRIGEAGFVCAFAIAVGLVEVRSDSALVVSRGEVRLPIAVDLAEVRSEYALTVRQAEVSLSIVVSLVEVQSALKKNYGTHVIKLDIAPVAFPLGQHLFISASNNMFYRHSQ